MTPHKHAHRLALATLASTQSKDSTKVGAVLSTPEGANILTGYNGPPMGVVDSPDRFERPRKYLFASHAEQNIVAFAARNGIRTAGCTLTVTHHPCSACARSIIQAGIVCVVVGDGQTSMPPEEFEAAAVMFKESGVRVETL